MPNYDYMCKYIIIGDKNVGKTNIMFRYIYNKFEQNYKPLIGVDFCIKYVELNDKTYRLQIWDTDGEEGHQSIIKPYYIGTACVLVIYDITNRNSFDNITTWIEDYKNNSKSEKMLIILVGNKSDLNDKRQVSNEEGQDLADKFGILFFETSAFTGENVNNIFEKSVEEIQKRINENYYDLEEPNCVIKKGNE